MLEKTGRGGLELGEMEAVSNENMPCGSSSPQPRWSSPVLRTVQQAQGEGAGVGLACPPFLRTSDMDQLGFWSFAVYLF